MKHNPKPTHRLEIVSDSICPWCYVAKRRLATALEMIADDLSFDVRWLPYELNPDMPINGLLRRDYRSKKFGSWAHSQELDRQVAAAAAEDGLTFHHDRIEKTPNTLASHVLVRTAAAYDRQNDVVEAVFRAYFVDGRDIGNPAVLADIGEEAGLDRSAVVAALSDDALRNDVRGEARGLATAGLRGVPTLLMNRFALFSGAHGPKDIAAVLRRATSDPKLQGTGGESLGA